MEAKEGDYVLTRDEYCTFCDAFYEAESLLRILKVAADPEAEDEDKGPCMMDVQALIEIIYDKLHGVERILGK